MLRRLNLSAIFLHHFVHFDLVAKILRRSSQGNPSVGGVKRKRGSKIERSSMVDLSMAISHTYVTFGRPIYWWVYCYIFQHNVIRNKPKKFLVNYNRAAVLGLYRLFFGLLMLANFFLFYLNFYAFARHRREDALLFGCSSVCPLHFFMTRYLFIWKRDFRETCH